MKKIAILALPLAFLFWSCAETIVMDPEEEMPVVVNCVLTNEGSEDDGIIAQYLDLYYAKRPSEAAPTPISDAKVVVKGRAQTKMLPSNFSGTIHVDDYYSDVHMFKWNGQRWECGFIPDYNTSYTLEITVGDLELKSRTFFPSCMRLFAVYANVDKDNEYIYYSGPYRRSHIAGYYFTKYFRHRKLISSSMEGHNSVSYYETYDGYAPYNGELYAWIKSEERLSTDHRDADRLNMIPGTFSDLEHNPEYWDEYWGSFSEEYQEYSSQLPLYYNFIHIHQQPGFKGAAPASAFAETSYFDGEQRQQVSPDYFFLLASDNPEGYGLGSFKVYYVSPEYDAYLRNLADVSIVHGEDFSSIYSAAPVYTNIEGGLGVFGAMTTGNRYPDPFYSN